MPYLMITTRCNMYCAHCCFSCGDFPGEDIKLETVKKTLRLFPKGEMFDLGGGEPTLHPELFEIIKMVKNEGQKVRVTTNGKEKDAALRLADMGRRKEIIARLSVDKWHEEIDIQVIAAFDERWFDKIPLKLNPDPNCFVKRQPYTVAVGRGARWNDSRQQCCCDAWTIDPKGDVWSCGCLKTCVGSVLDPTFSLPAVRETWPKSSTTI